MMKILFVSALVAYIAYVEGLECILSAEPPDPKTKCCGLESSSDRIIGGETTGIDQYPWLALIEYRFREKTGYFCGGALISGKYVLTAAHCVVGPIYKNLTITNVRLGEYDTSKDGPDCILVNVGEQDCTEGTVTIPIERIIAHPDYDPQLTSSQNDIALLRLTQTVKYTDFIRPICLPSKDVTVDPPSKLTLKAAGWGATEAHFDSNTDTTEYSSSSIKMHVGLLFKPLKLCQPAYRSKNVVLWEGQLCAGGERGKDTCKGDSGGPVMFYNNDDLNWEVAGVVSFGSSTCGTIGIPSVSTKVYHYLPWIRSHIMP